MTKAKMVPHNGPDFEAMMLEVDNHLAQDGCPIENRPILAVREASVRQGVPIPIGGDSNRLPPALKPYADLSAAISRWYDDTYGDRLKIRMSPGRTVVRLQEDLYALSVPRIFGGVAFCLTRTFLPSPTPGRGPVQCNILQLIEHLTPAKASRLSNDDLKTVEQAFATALQAAYSLEATPHPLLQSARNDIDTAVTALMDRGDRFGDSKWASLQAAEKTLKAAISLQDASFKFIHDLSKLALALKGLGVDLDAPDLLAAIQCTPGIRYGEETCTLQDALDAHAASLALVTRLRDAGARFNAGIGHPPHDHHFNR